MTKVGTTSRAKVTARFSRSSLCYTGLFVFKLACTPLFAYLTEIMPWSLPERHVQVWDSFDVFNNATFKYLHEHLNGQTMSNSSDLHFDSSTNTYAMRRRLEFPLEAVPTALQSSYLIRFQAAMFFGRGIQGFVNDFLSQDASARHKSRLYRCQRGYYFGAVSNDACLWLEPVLNGTASDEYEVYYGILVWESVVWSWCKLAFRCLLTLFIMRVMWQRYCRHYFPLLRGLEEIGIDAKFSRYEVIVGDPTYLILSDPLVGLVMLTDTLVAPAYVSWSLLRISQYKDIPALALGLFYFTRQVWCGYFVMRILSYVAKARQWENKFAPVDPGALGIGFFLFAGPLISLTANTPMMKTYSIMWTWLLPSALEFQGIEGATGVITGMLPTGFFPVYLSFALQKLHSSRQRRLRGLLGQISKQWTYIKDRCRCAQRVQSMVTIITPGNVRRPPNEQSENEQRNQHSHRAFNDVKNQFFFALMRWHAPEPPEKIGGSLHALYNDRPEYRSMPLFSCRAADCFILCYTPDGQVHLQVRLSFLDCLDTRTHDPELAIQTCSSEHNTSYATCNGETCSTFQPTSPGQVCIHRTRLGVKWVA
ncbi:hypothetical protein LEN26_013623 [Aphanomyces euteiches]|nr:hypothetical protein LEN26_013623 [Aphanomyces euteiches]